MRFDEALINFAVFRGAKEYMGAADVTPPDLTWITGTIRGAGIAGEVEYPILGHLQAMTLGLSFRTMTKDAVSLASPERKQIEVRGARQDEDTAAGKLVVTAIKHVYVIEGKSYSPGSFAPQSNSSGSGEYAVRYWAIYENGELVAELDPMNFKCVIDGVDYCADVRAALGK